MIRIMLIINNMKEQIVEWLLNLCRNEVIPENNVTLNFGVFESILKNRLFRDRK